MPSSNATDGPQRPVILSMEVDDDDDSSCDSEYRIQVGQHVKYLIVGPGTFDRDTLSFPISFSSHLPFNEQWTVARMSRDPTSGDLKVSLEERQLVGVQCQWHQNKVNCLDLAKTEQLTASALEAELPSSLQTSLSLPPIVIAKIARFEWEIPRIEQETRAYQLLEGTGLAPRFLAHVHESGRITGFLLEKVEGRPASLQDLDICRLALASFHKLGFKHGDVNRYNFLIKDGKVTLIDFERLEKAPNSDSLEEELNTLSAELVDESGRGGGFIFHEG